MKNTTKWLRLKKPPKVLIGIGKSTRREATEMEIKRVNVSLGAGLVRSMFAVIEDGEIIELAPTREELEEKETTSERS
tara:strand:- start:4607 stop:4840 length:234 start_codon:yes stop_codon:yes gene_type:complete